jgi:hypothetical protein
MRAPRIADSGTGNKTTGRVAARVFDVTATIIFWIAICALIIHLFLKLYPLIEPTSSAATLNADFVIFWAGGKLAFAGQPLMVHDAQALFAATELPGPPPDAYSWLYPASFLVAMMPFGALPFPLAFLAFVLISIITFALVVRAPASVLPGLWRLLLASPALLYGGEAIGQTSILWAAGLIAGLWAMRA